VGGTIKEIPSKLTLPVTIQIGNTTKDLLALVDSGAEQNLLDPALALQLHLPPGIITFTYHGFSFGRRYAHNHHSQNSSHHSDSVW